MLQALLFDFDGVVIDGEPIHMDGFRRVLQSEFGVGFTDREYYQRYVAFDDREAFARMTRDYGIACDAEGIARLMALKASLVQQALAGPIGWLPGTLDLMRSARAADLAVAVCSGALRAEIELPLRSAGAASLVQVIVSAEDVPTSKPDPAGYDLTRRRLAAHLRRELPKADCVVVEDSPGGVAAGKAAGMTVLAVTNSVPADRLARADCVVSSLADVTVADLRRLAGE